jgi:type II secretory pathway component PulM
MITWFEQLAPRERIIVLISSFVMALLVIFLSVVEPIQNKQKDANEKLTSENILLEYMSKSATKLVKQGNLSTKQTVKSSATPYILVDQNIKRLLLNQPDKMSPLGQNAISFRYKSVSFDKLIQLIQNLQTQGLHLTQLTTTKIGIGLVSCRVKMEKS